MITCSVKSIAVGATVGLSAVLSFTSDLVAQNTFEPSLLVGEWSEAGQCNNSRHVLTPDGRYRWIENQRGKWTTSFQGIYRITASDTVAIAEKPNAGGIGLQISSLTQTLLSAKWINEDDDKALPVTYTRCSVAAVSPASPSTATKPRASGVQPNQTNSTGVSGTSLATQPVGTAKCSGIQGDNANTRPIQKATLEPRAGGYNLRLTEIKQGTPVESLLELNNQLQIQSARTLGVQGGEWNDVVFRGTPVKIQPTGAFSINMMVSSRSACDFSGTLQFAGNAQARLFPGSSAQARNPSQLAPSAAKIAEGVYWVGTTGMALEVKGGQYQYRDEETTTSWKPISELTPIKDGVLKTGETYWCLSTLPKPQNSRLAVCSASGWTVSPPVASNPSLGNSASNSPTSKPPFVSSPIQIVPSPGKSPVASPSPSPTPQPSPSPIPSPSPTPSSPRVTKVPPLVKPPEWVGRNTQSNIPESAFSDANSACQSYGDPKTNPVRNVELLYVNQEDKSQGVYGANCYYKSGEIPQPIFVYCPDEVGENYSYLAKYNYFVDEKDENKGECRRVELIGTIPTDALPPVAQQPQGSGDRTPEALPTPPAQKPQDKPEPTPSPTPTPTPQAPQNTKPSNQPASIPSSSSSSPGSGSERGETCEKPVDEEVKPGLSRWWATAGDKNKPVIPVTWTVNIPDGGEGEYTLNIIPKAANTWKLSGKDNGKPTFTINSSKKVRDFERTNSRNYTASLGCLKPGKHQLKIEGFQVPDKPVIEEIKFELEGKSPPKPLEALFVADRPEVKGINAEDLVKRYAPILYFDAGSLQDDRQEEYANLYDAAASSKKTDLVNGDSTHQLTLSKTATGIAYATVAQNEQGETAISYYFHYPNSNWNDFKGHNNHLGDWEGITVFLKGDTPDRVAYSQHVSLSDLGVVSDQSDGGIVVPWKYVDREGERVKVYVGLGGHASYPFPGITRWLTGLELHKGDLNVVRTTTRLLHRAGNFKDDYEKLNPDDAWLLYSGQWGTSDDSPRGPMFLDVSKDLQSTESGTGLRWLDPWKWSSRFGTRKLQLGDDSNNLLVQGTSNEIIMGGAGNDNLAGFISSNPYLLKGGSGDDTYALDGDQFLEQFGGVFIQDEGGNDKLTYFAMGRNADGSHPEINFTLHNPQKGSIGLARFGNSLIIDLNQNGVAEMVENNYTTVSDLAILDFFGDGEGGRGKGFIEEVGNLTGESILQYFGKR